MKSLIFALVLGVFSPLPSWGQALPAMPDCQSVPSAKLRSEKLETYVDQIETAVEANKELLKTTEYSAAVRMVAAYLLPEETMFRRHKLECWAAFEEARQALKQENASEVQTYLTLWQSCLKIRDDGSLATAAPLLQCFAPSSPPPSPKAAKK